MQEKLIDTTNASSAASYEGLMYNKVIFKIFCVFWRSERSHRNIQRGWKNRKKIRPDVCHNLLLVMTYLILSVTQNLLISSSFNSYFSQCFLEPCSWNSSLELLQYQSVVSSLTLYALTPQNVQTHSNNSSSICRRIVWMCLTIL